MKISKTTRTFGLLYEVALVLQTFFFLAILIIAIAIYLDRDFFHSQSGLGIFIGVMFLFLILLLAIAFIFSLVLTIVNFISVRKMRKNSLSKGFLIANMVILFSWIFGALQFIWRIILDERIVNRGEVFPYGLVISFVFIIIMALGIVYSILGLRDVRKYEKEKWLNMIKRDPVTMNTDR